MARVRGGIDEDVVARKDPAMEPDFAFDDFRDGENDRLAGGQPEELSLVVELVVLDREADRVSQEREHEDAGKGEDHREGDIDDLARSHHDSQPLLRFVFDLDLHRILSVSGFQWVKVFPLSRLPSTQITDFRPACARPLPTGGRRPVATGSIRGSSGCGHGRRIRCGAGCASPRRPS